MDRRAFLTGVSAAAISATLPSGTGYLRRAVLVTVIWQVVSLPRAPGPGMTDWRQATPAEIIGDIHRALSVTDQSPAVREWILAGLPAPDLEEPR